MSERECRSKRLAKERFSWSVGRIPRWCIFPLTISMHPPPTDDLEPRNPSHDRRCRRTSRSRTQTTTSLVRVTSDVAPRWAVEMNLVRWGPAQLCTASCVSRQIGGRYRQPRAGPISEDDREVHQPVESWFDGSDAVCHVKSASASALTTLHVLQKRIWHPRPVWLPIIHKTWSHYNWSITRQIRPRHRCHVTHLVDHRL